MIYTIIKSFIENKSNNSFRLLISSHFQVVERIVLKQYPQYIKMESFVIPFVCCFVLGASVFNSIQSVAPNVWKAHTRMETVPGSASSFRRP